MSKNKSKVKGSKVNTKKKHKASATTFDANEKFVDVELGEIAEAKYYTYGMSVLEDRSFPDIRDGLGPVHRRILYAAYKMGLHNGSQHVKCARIVGETMGKFHPHGDQSIYKALVGMAKQNACIPYIDGQGNYGSYTDRGFAAMRYTEAKLTKFADEIYFNKFYTPVITYVPNYDSKEVEPLLLPALLPTMFLNGGEGIAPGATTYVPSFTFKSVMHVLKSAYAGEELTPKLLYQTLKMTGRLGGVEEPLKTKEEKLERLAMFKTAKGKATLHSTLELDVKQRTITLTALANVVGVESFLGKLQSVDGVQATSSVYPMDITGKHDPYPIISIPLVKQKDPKAYDKVLQRVKKAASANENCILNYAQRYIDDLGFSQAKVDPMSITQSFIRWIEWRTDLERRACQYWIEEQDKIIRRLDLLILAVDNRKLIIESLDKDLDQDKLEQWLAKKLKITVDDAHAIYQLRVVQLRKLEKKTLQEQKKEIIAKRKELETRKKKPLPFMLKQLDDLAKFV